MHFYFMAESAPPDPPPLQNPIEGTKRKHVCYDRYYLSSMGDARKDLPQTIITT